MWIEVIGLYGSLHGGTEDTLGWGLRVWRVVGMGYKSN